MRRADDVGVTAGVLAHAMGEEDGAAGGPMRGGSEERTKSRVPSRAVVHPLSGGAGGGVHGIENGPSMAGKGKVRDAAEGDFERKECFG